MDGNPTILALDAAGAACSAALWLDGRVSARRFEAMRRGQSERLVPMIEEVIAGIRKISPRYKNDRSLSKDICRVADTVDSGDFCKYASSILPSLST